MTMMHYIFPFWRQPEEEAVAEITGIEMGEYDEPFSTHRCTVHIRLPDGTIAVRSAIHNDPYVVHKAALCKRSYKEGDKVVVLFRRHVRDRTRIKIDRLSPMAEPTVALA